MPADDWTIAYVALGANLHDPLTQLRCAVQALRQQPQVRVTAVSPVYRSAPVQASGPDFYNAVMGVQTTLSAPDLLTALHQIEHQQGRERPYVNAPRTLDLDLILFGDVVMTSTFLTLPHPRAHQRAFVLQPLLDIAPDSVIPGHGPAFLLRQAITDQALERVSDQTIDVLL